MHHSDPSPWQHSHRFAEDTSIAERRTHWVIGITGTMMVAEIIAGIAFGSMALLADGWHMSTHFAAFLITALAYYFGRRHANDPRFSFGTGKMGVLGGFASAVFLLIIAVLMAAESLHRFFSPMTIQFDRAIIVAVVGLLVNLVCALLLKEDHHHHHGHVHSHEHHHGHHGHHDLNRRAAFIHVLADALTSVTAIIALIAGKFMGWVWLDPVMGIVGGIVVTTWAIGLLRQTSGILLDRIPESSDLPEEIRDGIESDGDALITDLHVWQVAAGKFAAIIGIVADQPLDPNSYRQRVAEHEELVHVTIQVERCKDTVTVHSQ